MELEDQFYMHEKYLETTSGNKVNRECILFGTSQIVLLGKAIILKKAILRGDMASIKIGRYTVIKEGACIRPAFKKYSKGVAYFPLEIGDHVVIEENVVSNAAQIGSFVHIGKNAVVGRRCILKDCCALLPDTVLPAETAVPPFAIFGGNPGKLVGFLPECTVELMMQYTMDFHEHFKPISTAATKS